MKNHQPPAVYKLCVLGFGLSQPQFVHMQHRNNNNNSFAGTWGREALDTVVVQCLTLCWAWQRMKQGSFWD